MTITLPANGRDMTFSKQALTAIVETHFKDVNNEEVFQSADNCKCFEVMPLDINQEFFNKKRKDEKQEELRKIIQAAFAKLKENPEKYGRNFTTMIPQKTWDFQSVEELQQMASSLGDHLADWVEQSLEWAQKIANGESWESICNLPDNSDWYRLVIWNNGYTRLIGGSHYDCTDFPISQVSYFGYPALDILDDTVPLVVLYK